MLEELADYLKDLLNVMTGIRDDVRVIRNEMERKNEH